jgi:hypothetical protein
VVLSAESTLGKNPAAPPFRTSPLFPLDAEFAAPDLSIGRHFIHFFCFPEAFGVLGRLQRDGGAVVLREVFYSIGLASVIVVTRRTGVLAEVLKIANTMPRARETWTCEGGLLTGVDCKPAEPGPTHFPSLKVRPYDTLPLAIAATVDEFVANMALLVHRVSADIPSELRTFTSLVKRVNSLIAEMVYSSRPNGAPPPTLSEYSEDDFRRTPELGEIVLHQASDRLVQVNSALSYLTTQALSGAIPLLERRSLIRRHSLLGVGSAFKSVARVARSIEKAFLQGGLEQAMTGAAAEAAPLPGLQNLPLYDPTEWPDHSFDRWQPQVNPDEHLPKLPYFSGRLGFRETEFTISAALHSLTAGASPEWSLLTVTHEMVHGHVRSLLSVLFQGVANQQPKEKWDTFYDRFALTLKGQSPAKPTFLDSLRAVVLAYCCLSANHGSMTREPLVEEAPRDSTLVRKKMHLLSRRRLWRQLEREYRNISEIIVHVLDLHYFYGSRLSTYIQLIWRSWAPLPQVRGDVRQYVLRSMLAIAPRTTGSTFERFTSASAMLRAYLAPLGGTDKPPSVAIARALELLNNRDALRAQLFHPFSASVILADLAHDVLTSAAVREAVFAADRHALPKESEDADEAWLEYTMPSGFVDARVLAPAVFLADRLAAQKAHLDGALEAETALLLLACCSESDTEESTS